MSNLEDLVREIKFKAPWFEVDELERYVKRIEEPRNGPYGELFPKTTDIYAFKHLSALDFLETKEYEVVAAKYSIREGNNWNWIQEKLTTALYGEIEVHYKDKQCKHFGKENFRVRTNEKEEKISLKEIRSDKIQVTNVLDEMEDEINYVKLL